MKAVLLWLVAPLAHKLVQRILFAAFAVVALAAIALHLWGGPILLTVLRWRVHEKTGADLGTGKTEVEFWKGRAVLEDVSIERAEQMSVRIPRATIVSGPWRHLVGRRQVETVTLERPSVRVVEGSAEKERSEVYMGISDLTITAAEFVIVDPSRPEAVREIRLSKLAVEHARYNNLDHIGVLRTAQRVEGELTLAGSTGRLYIGDRDGKRTWEFGDVDLGACETLWPGASKLPFKRGRADLTCTFADGGTRLKVVLREAKPDKSKVALAGLSVSSVAALGAATFEVPIDYDPHSLRGSIGEALRRLWIAMGDALLTDIIRKLR